MPGTALKIDLMRELHQVVQDYNLQDTDRTAILQANEAGRPLPPRKPRARRDVVAESASGRRARPYEKRTSRFKNRSERGKAKKEVKSTTDEGSIGVPNTAQNCIVCYDDMKGATVPERAPTLSCSHDVDVCRKCLAQTIATEFTSNMWDHIGCPTCGERLTADDVNRFGNQDLATKCLPPYLPLT